ncbi:MAG: LuxR C-terminal-related transcriptional regulator, partial [Chloroflexota bacterium]
GFASVGDYAMVDYTIWVELLLITLPYRTEQMAERHRLLADAELAWDRAVGTTLGASHRTQCGLLVDLLEGRWNEARELARQGISGPNSHLVQGAVTNLGVLARHQGEAGVAWEQVNTLLPEGPHTEPGDSFFPHALAAQRLAAELALDADDLNEARRWIEAHGHWLDWSGAQLWRGDHHLLLTRYHHIAGEMDSARQHAETALQYASDPRQPLVLLAAHRFLGHFKIDIGEFDDARDHLQASLDLAERCEAPYEIALTKLEFAELAVQTDEAGEATRLLREVRAICEHLGAQRSLDHVEQLEDRLRAADRAYPAGLSMREVEVLELVAEGLTNAEVADHLFIGTRTVGSHLRSVYNKLGVNSRAAAVARWAELGQR